MKRRGLLSKGMADASVIVVCPTCDHQVMWIKRDADVASLLSSTDPVVGRLASCIRCRHAVYAPPELAEAQERVRRHKVRQAVVRGELRPT